MARALTKKMRCSKSENAARVEVIVPAAEAALQRGTLVIQSAEKQFARLGRRSDRGVLEAPSGMSGST
jgi:hypothetical protein